MPDSDVIGAEDGESVSDAGHGPAVPAPSVEPEDSWLGADEVIRILKFCGQVGRLLGLPDFRYVFAADPSEEDCHASVTVASKRYVAVVAVNKEWGGYTVRAKAESLAHEVLHCFMARLDEIWDQACFNDFIPSPTAQMLQRVWVREMELVVDLLTMFVYNTKDLEKLWDDCGPSEEDEVTPIGPS